tara:strand:- start:1362 stop:2012 length:651 start_codon:yes stop_codon:yes gene_type:complete
MPPVRIAIDIDEVLCPFVRTMTRWKYPKDPPTVPPRHPYNYATMFSITPRESKKMVDSFYFSQDFRDMQPFPQSQVQLKCLNACGYDLYCVTGRQQLARDNTEEWIQKHYPGVFRDLILTNSFTTREIKKSSVCESLSLAIIIDDSYETCMECMEQGVHSIHFIGDPVYPWCQVNEYSEKTWKGVYENILTNTPGEGPSPSCEWIRGYDEFNPNPW